MRIGGPLPFHSQSLMLLPVRVFARPPRHILKLLMLSTIFLVASLSQPPSGIVEAPPAKRFQGDVLSGPPRASVPAKPRAPVAVDAPAPKVYTVEAIRGLPGPKLPTGYPTELQQQFPTTYRRDDQ